MKKLNSEQKCYYLYVVLKKFSSEEHKLTFNEINSHMEECFGGRTYREAFRRHIKILKELGMDISDYGENGEGYYLREQQFEPWEQKLLIDLVCRSYSISRRITQRLIDKIMGLHNQYTKYALQKGFDFICTPKTVNEEVPYTMDKLRRAYLGNKKVRFTYYDYDMTGALVPRKKEGIIREYKGSPYALINKKNCYYSVINIDRFENLSNYRVDRMKQVEVLEEDAKPITECRGCRKGLNLEEYAGKCFNMFVGNEVKVTLEIDKRQLNFIIEELGDQVKIVEKEQKEQNKQEEDTYLATFRANEGEGLVKWILQMGDQARVVAPDSLVVQVREKIAAMNKRYQPRH